ncbi:MAG: hypothetical protein K8T10_12250 [Candidatus Eremiobacteraeota bacterium]|nr:hypothetical protein [Candidatus Eremiobacteraeota bacterium]
MSGIGAVGGPDRQLSNLPAKFEKKEDSTPAEPMDKVEIKKDISKPRKMFEKVIGSPLGVVTSAANTVGGLVGGGVAGVTAEADEAEGPHIISSGVAYVAMGATTGAIIGTPVIGGIVGGVVGLIFAIVAGTSGSMEKISEKVGEAAQKVVSDNEPTESKIKDASRDFTEGGLTGMGIGTVEGFKEGTRYGAGIVSGVIEGTKGVVSSALGKYEEPAEPKPEVEKTGLGKKVLSAVLGAPRFILGKTVGLAGAVAGMGIESVDGAIQGTMVGVDNDERADKSFHAVLMRINTALAGAGTGFALGGPIGGAIGLGSGLVLGHIIRRVEKKTGADKEITKNLTSAVRYAQKDNVYEKELDEYGDQEKNVYETFRDGVEGMMTGTSAGAREGFKGGYNAGKGVVDGVFDGVKGLFEGIFG